MAFSLPSNRAKNEWSSEMIHYNRSLGGRLGLVGTSDWGEESEKILLPGLLQGPCSCLGMVVFCSGAFGSSAMRHRQNSVVF